MLLLLRALCVLVSCTLTHLLFHPLHPSPKTGQGVAPAFLQSVFSIQSLQGIDCSQLVLLQNPDDLSQRVNAIINALREERSPFMQLNVVAEGDQNEPRFFWHLVRCVRAWRAMCC